MAIDGPVPGKCDVVVQAAAAASAGGACGRWRRALVAVVVDCWCPIDMPLCASTGPVLGRCCRLFRRQLIYCSQLDKTLITFMIEIPYKKIPL